MFNLHSPAIIFFDKSRREEEREKREGKERRKVEDRGTENERMSIKEERGAGGEW